jgi:hypothetical protein
MRRDEAWALDKALAFLDRRPGGAPLDRARPRVHRTWRAFFVELDLVVPPGAQRTLPGFVQLEVSRLTGRVTYGVAL